jgi:WD40 repeat protein
VAVADDNGEVKVFGFNDGKLIYINNSHSYPVTSIRISPDSKTMISGDTSGAIFIWKL